MTKYIIQRIIVSIPIFFGITMIVFALYALAPGDPLAMLLGERAMLEMTAEELEAARDSLGLNDPWLGRYLTWLSRAIQGDLGYPLTGGYTVMELLQQRIGPTLLLMATAFAVSLLAGVPMGIVMALKQYSWIDYLVTVLAFAQLSIPSFFLALGAMYVFSLKLDIFPTSGLQTIGEPFSLWDRIHHLIMPSFILAAYFAGVWARYTRSSMLETMHLEFVTTARAKGAEGTGRCRPSRSTQCTLAVGYCRIPESGSTAGGIDNHRDDLPVAGSWYAGLAGHLEPGVPYPDGDHPDCLYYGSCQQPAGRYSVRRGRSASIRYD